MEINRKFIETLDASEWQVETDTGWKDIEFLGKTIEYDEWILKTKSGLELICADTHIVFNQNFEEVFIQDLKEGDKIQTKNGLDIVESVIKTDKKSNMYDLQLSENSDRRFYTNDILSHNSMWLQNMAVKIVEAGKNVAIITLEMGVNKVMKRLGSMRLKIPSKEYDEKSRDPIFMKNRLNSLKNTNGGVFENKQGKIFVKKFPTGACTISDIDNYINKLQEIKKIKIDAVIVDYLNIMGLERGLDFNEAMLYLKGKHLAEGLRYLADKHNVLILSATQTDKAVWGGNDLKISAIPESKAIAETADVVWGIIRNTDMKRANKYQLKILKLRDGEHKEEKIVFDFNPDFLTMENDNIIGNK